MTKAYATDGTIIIEWYDGDGELQWCCGYSDTAPETFEWETVGSVASAASDYIALADGADPVMEGWPEDIWWNDMTDFDLVATDDQEYRLHGQPSTSDWWGQSHPTDSAGNRFLELISKIG